MRVFILAALLVVVAEGAPSPQLAQAHGGSNFMHGKRSEEKEEPFSPADQGDKQEIREEKDIGVPQGHGGSNFMHGKRSVVDASEELPKEEGRLERDGRYHNLRHHVTGGLNYRMHG